MVVAIVAPPVVTAVVAVATMAAIVAEDAVIEANYKHNKKNKDPDKYINNQNDGDFHNWKFGVSTMDKNGCGVIAVYNLLRMRGETKNLADVAYEIENNTGTLILGIFGTDPTHFGEYFRSKKIKVTEYTNLTKLEDAAKEMSTSQKIVLEIWNEPSILKGAHAVAVEKVDKIFYIYNGEYDGTLLPYNTLNEYISKSGGSLIIGYVVG
ncbi:MAG: hypothetical protein LBF12_04715 [Christensenellaceae bacterium]|nr:hypothetical protein [Christensenellaceae bacterium]